MCALYAHNSKVLCDHSSVNKLNIFITECIVFCFAITARPAWQGGQWPTQLLYRLIINIAHIRYCMCMCLIMQSVCGIQGQHTQNSTVQQRGYHLQIAAIIIIMAKEPFHPDQKLAFPCRRVVHIVQQKYIGMYNYGQ